MKKGILVLGLLAIAIACFIGVGAVFQKHASSQILTSACFTCSSNGQTAYYLRVETGSIFITVYAPRDDKDFASIVEKIITLACKNGFDAGYQPTEGSPTQKILLQCNYVSDFKSLLLDLMGSFYDVRVEYIK